MYTIFFTALSGALSFAMLSTQLQGEPIQTSDNATAQTQGWLTFENLRVDVRGGVRLIKADGNPLRASAIAVWADDIRWQAGYQLGMHTSPADNHTGFAGIIVYQKSGADCRLAATSFNPPGTICNLSGQDDIYVRVNDGEIGNTNDGHGDNGGSFDLHVKVRAP
ncbi:MAG: hypothetical protein ACLGHC_09635 [Alphaproteobacteria bacterium]